MLPSILKRYGRNSKPIMPEPDNPTPKICPICQEKLYYIKVKGTDKTELYEFDGVDDLGQDVNVSVKTFVKRLGNIKNNGKKFIVIDGKVKVHFPIPPKKVLSDGSRINVFDNLPAIIECKFKHTPVHDIDLTDIGTAYDQNLADAIVKEATDTGENELPDEDI